MILNSLDSSMNLIPKKKIFCGKQGDAESCGNGARLASHIGFESHGEAPEG